MFNNVNAKKRLTQVIVAFVIICMAFTGSFLLLDDAISQASAEDRTVSTQGQWNNVMAEAKNGGTWNITLGGNIAITSTTGGKLDAVPAGATVNLNMNNYSITWDYAQTGGDWNGDLMATSYTSGTYASGTYWGFITNNGTLNIQGTGTIRNKKIHYTTQKENRDNAVQRLATIVNSGTLTVGGNIVVEAYLSSVHNSDDSWSTASYSDNYLYNFGIYSNGGTVNSSAKISVGGLAGTSQTGTSGRAYNLCYGIYGNNSADITVSGGNILIDSFSGGFMETGSGEKAHMYAASIGVFGNNAKISGNTTINVLAKNWEYQSQNSNTWKNGIDHLLSVGVMYVGSNYPVIGPSVDVVASFEHIGDNKTQVYVPGHSGLSWSNVFSDGAAGNISHVAAPIGGIAGNPVNNIGSHTSETDYGAAFFGNSSPYESIKDRHQYLTAQSYYSGKKTTTVAPRIDNGSNDSIRSSAAIVNGAPGNTGTGGLTNADSGNPGDKSPAASGFKKGSQYLFVYRFYTDVNNIESVSFRNDSGKLNSDATVTVGTSAVTNGIVPDNNSKIYHSGGGAPKNAKFYSFEGAFYETIESSSSSLKSRLDDISADGKATTPSNWKGSKSILPADGVTVSTEKDNVIIIYLDYKKHEATSIKVVAADKGVNVTEYTETTSFTVPYTGENLKPGVDFNLGILDVAYNNAVVTGDYDYKQENNGKPTVKYEYSSNGTSWTDGLPKNVGTYLIRVSVNADSVTNNRQGAQATLTCTITPGNVEITGGANSINLTYGDSYASIFDKYDFKAVNASGADITGQGSFTVSEKTLSSLPNAGAGSITIQWKPNDASNYSNATRSVNLEVAKKEITIGVAAKEVTYGDALPASSFELTYSTPIVAADSTKLAGWLAATKFEVEKDGVWQAYGNGLNVGEYNFKISAFGGSSDSNYNFKIDSTPVKLTVVKRAIQYTATATDRVYEKGNNEVFVTLSLPNPSNAYGGDSFPAVINTKGTVDENAGANKKVTVDKNVNIGNNNYYLVIIDENELTVNIAKADPTDVYVAAKDPNLTYDKTQTLASVELAATENPEIPGTWAWVNANEVPAVTPSGESKYLARFTPDSSNYNTCEQYVTLYVDKAVVQIVVDADASTPDVADPFNVTYGDAVPALNKFVKYIGFTGDDTIDTVPHDGNADVSTDYNPTSSVRDGGYTVSVNHNLVADNYEFTTVNNKIFVNKKALTVTVNDRTITYGDKVPTFKDADVKAEGFANSETLSVLNATLNFTTDYKQNAAAGKVGAYDINVDVITSNSNYDITCVPGTLTVERKTLTLTPVSKTISFGAALPEYKTPVTDYTVDGLVNGDTTAVLGGTFAVSTQYKSGSYVNTYIVTADVKGMTAENYKFAAGSSTLNVVKAVPSITTAPGASVVNSHTLATATFDNTAVVVNPNNSDLSVAGTFKFNSADTTPVWGTTTAYTATFTPVDDDNYTTTTVNVVVEVTVKTISGIPVIQGSAMVGSELSVSLAAVDPNADVYTYQWFRVDGTVATAISGATNAKYTVTNEDLNKTIYVVIDADEAKGFTGKAESAKTSAVIEALLETTRDMFAAMFPNNATEVIYNANDYEVVVSVADAFADHIFGNITVKYNGSTEPPKNAGTYNVTIDVDAPASKTGNGYDDGYEYQAPVSGMPIDTLVIKPATLTANVAANDKIYDGTVNAIAEITFDGVYAGDSIELAPGAKYVFDNKNAGENKTVTATNIVIENTGNYVIDESTLKTTASILPKTLEVTANGVRKAYDKSALVDVEFDVNEDTYASADNASTIYLTNGKGIAESVNVAANIKVDTITYDKAGSSAGNYVVVITNDVRVEIIKATPVVVAPVISVVYGPAKTLGQIKLSEYNPADGYWEFIDTTIVPTVQVKTYAARFIPKDGNNYNNLESEKITVNVTPLEVVLKADDKSVTYGANAPTYTFKPISGITADVLATVGGSCKAVCYEYVPGANYGSYEIVVLPSYTDDNYTFKTESGWLTVSRATINVTATADSKVYDGFRDVKVNFAIQSGVYAGDVNAVDLSVKSTTGTAATQNAGVTKVVSYEKPALVGGKAGNYMLNITPIEGALTVEILKADITGVEFPTGAQVEYGYDLTHATFNDSGDAKGGSFAYENAKVTVPGNLGVYDTYKVIYTPADAINYNTQEAYVTLQVVKCTLNYVVGVAGNLQSGQTLTAVTTGLPAAANEFICYQWYRVDGDDYELIKGATDKTYVATDADVGYTLVVMTYFDDNDPFVYEDGSFEAIEDIKGIIGQSTDAIKEITLTFWQRIMNWLYRILAVLTGIQLNGGLGI